MFKSLWYDPTMKRTQVSGQRGRHTERFNALKEVITDAYINLQGKEYDKNLIRVETSVTCPVK